MTHASSPLPLGRFALARTNDVDEFEGIVRSIFGGISVDPTDNGARFNASSNYHQLFHSGIYYGEYGSRVRIEIPSADFVAQGVTLEGRGAVSIGRIQIGLAQDKLPPAVFQSRRASLDFDDTHRHLAFCISPVALSSKVAAMIGDDRGRQATMHEGVQVSADELARFRRLLLMLVAEIDMAETPVSPVFLQEMEQALMVCFILAYRGDFNATMPDHARKIAPWQVSRVEQFVEAHWNEPLSIEAIAAEVGASVRSIQLSFKASRGYTPMEFVRQVRLGHARRMLSAGSPETRVIDVAYACCFGNVGHFSKFYSDQFGELPSITLARARQRLS